MSPIVIPVLAASESPENLLEMPFLCPHPRTIESEILGMESTDLFLISLPGDLEAHKSLRTTDLDIAKCLPEHTTKKKIKEIKKIVRRKGETIGVRHGQKKS